MNEAIAKHVQPFESQTPSPHDAPTPKQPRKRSVLYAFHVLAIAAVVVGYFAGYVLSATIAALFAIALFEFLLHQHRFRAWSILGIVLLMLSAVGFGVLSNQQSHQTITAMGALGLHTLADTNQSFERQGHLLLDLLRNNGMTVRSLTDDTEQPWLWGVRNDKALRSLASIGTNLALFGPLEYEGELRGVTWMDAVQSTKVIQLLPNNTSTLMEEQKRVWDDTKKSAHEPVYLSLVITCMYTDQGKLLVVESTPRGAGFNLLGSPVGKPHIQACQEAYSLVH